MLRCTGPGSIRGKIIMIKKKKSVAALPTQALRFVSLTLSLKNICKSENPTSDSVDAQNYPVS